MLLVLSADTGILLSCSSPGLKLSCSLAAAVLGRTLGTGWGLSLHANVFSWKPFSAELLVQEHSGVMAVICAWGIKEMRGLYRAEEPSESEMAGGISTSKPKINCFAKSSSFIPWSYSL